MELNGGRDGPTSTRRGKVPTGTTKEERTKRADEGDGDATRAADGQVTGGEGGRKEGWQEAAGGGREET